MPNYLHGSETVILSKGAKQIKVIKSAVIFLVGTAPKGPVNTPTLVSSDADIAQFGEELTGYTIPQALSAIFAQGPATVIVVNVVDITADLTTVAAETHTITDGKTKTTFMPHTWTSLTHTSGTPVYVRDQDYSVDDFGNVQVLDLATIAEGASIKINYKYLTVGGISNAQIIGAYDPDDDTYTGLECAKQCKQLFGFKPKIIIAPGFSSVEAVAQAMDTIALAMGGNTLVDAPAATTIADAIAGRGVAGTINFYTSSKAVILCFPMVKAYDIATDADQDRPLSQFAAGVLASVDYNEGYHVSPSNHEIKGITGVETLITWDPSDANSNANLLNEVGIMTLAQGFGTGIRLWGNRNASYPNNTGPDSFIPVYRTANVIDESVQDAAVAYVDQPINNAIIDSIVESGNSFMRTQIQRGALVDGEVSYVPEDNTEEELAAGHLVFRNTYMPPPPAERITFNRYIDITLLKSLGQTQ